MSDLWPITHAVGLIRSPLEKVVAELVAWRTELGEDSSTRSLAGGLAENVTALEPLTAPIAVRELFVATANPEWTARFDCAIRGSDQVSPVSVLSERLATTGIVLVSVPHEPDTTGRLGASQFYVFSPESEDRYSNHRRTVSVTFDDPKWTFDQAGEPFEFEDLTAFRRRRIVDRFPRQALLDYAAEFGITPEAENFFSGPSILVEAPREPKAEMSLHEAQESFRQGAH